MLFYGLFACTPLLVALVVKLYYQCPIRENKRAKRAFLVFSGLILWLIIGLRDSSMGSTDSYKYYLNWRNMAIRNLEGLKANIADSRMEPVYLCTAFLLSKVFPHPQFTFVLSGLFFTIAVCRFIYKNSDDVVISFVMFITWGLYSFMVQGLRQAIAMSICLFSIEPAKKRQLIRFLLIILLACCFHASAIVFAVAYFVLIPWKRLSFNNKLQMITAMLILIACSGIIIFIINNYFNRNYVEPIDDGGYVALILYLMIIIGALLFIQHSKSTGKSNYEVILLGSAKERLKETLFMALTMIGFSFYFMRYMGVGIIQRASFYFQFGQIILLPAVLKRFDRDTRRVGNAMLVILSVLLFMYRVETSGLTPYLFFF